MSPRSYLLVVLISLVMQYSWGQDLSANQEFKDTNGKSYTLNSFNSSKAVVFIFYCNSCPFSNYYNDRIVNLQESYKEIAFLLVNSSPEKYDENESQESMVAISTQLGLTYINDKSQNLKGALKATKCPEVFLYVKKSGTWEVFYHGAIDDNPKDPGSVKEKYLEEAISSFFSNQPLQEDSNRPIGCVIKTG